MITPGFPVASRSVSPHRPCRRPPLYTPSTCPQNGTSTATRSDVCTVPDSCTRYTASGRRRVSSECLYPALFEAQAQRKQVWVRKYTSGGTTSRCFL